MFNKLLRVSTVALVFVSPLVFLPLINDVFELGRQLIILVLSFLIFVVWGVKVIKEQKLTYRTPVWYSKNLLLFATAFLAAALINSPNKLAAFTAVGGAGAIIISLLVFYLLKYLGDRALLVLAYLASAAALAVVNLVFFSGKITILGLPTTFTPAGNLIVHAVILVAALPLGLALIYDRIRARKLAQAGSLALVSLLIIGGLGITAYLLSTTARAILLPQGTAWAVAVETLKNGRNALFGLGPGQFINAFTAFKPLGFNNTELWNLRFGSSANWYYQLLTEVGLLGLVAYVFLVIQVGKNTWRTLRQARLDTLKLGIYFSLSLVLLAQFFLPVNFLFILTAFILLALAEDEERKSLDLRPLGKATIPLGVFPLVFWGALLYFAGRSGLANYYYQQSLIAANQNDGVATYNLQVRAITTDPSASLYRAAYAQTNLALASSLAAQEEVSENDRATISQLLQQAIREAKATVALDPNSASGWENLAAIYRSLINLAEGADQWTVDSYQQAINLDPLNPRLRVDLGGVFYSQKDYNTAANLFAQAVNLKPDYANAHYNLAVALKEVGQYQAAVQQYEATLGLVKIDSNDYQLLLAEMEEVKKLLPTPTPTPRGQQAAVPETLTTPEPPPAGIEPPVELPNAEPPLPTESPNP